MKVAFQSESFLAMLYINAVMAGEITFCKAQIVNCIQQVCFTHTVFAADACNPLGKTKISMTVIFELGKRYGIKLEHELVQDKRCRIYFTWLPDCPILDLGRIARAIKSAVNPLTIKNHIRLCAEEI